MGKNSKAKKEAARKVRLQRLAARLTMLNANMPGAGASDYQRKMWADERAQLIRQLRRHGIEMGA